jgi:hypothetical protein
VPCPRGCCLVWNGHEKLYAGPAWLQYLIDHFLRHDAHARTSGDSQFTGFTFDHEMNGMIVGEQGDNRELFLLRVEANEVTREILRRGDPALPWEPGYQGLDDRPWLAGERPWRSSLDFLRPSSQWRRSPSRLGGVGVSADVANRIAPHAVLRRNEQTCIIVCE